ncbi:MAG: PQQ-dependent sugar dehydrogenase [Pseudomonadota bacterium]
MHRITLAIALPLLLSACGNSDARKLEAGAPFTMTEIARFDEPWAMVFLPDGRALVTEKAGELILWSGKGPTKVSVSGTPKPVYGGQGGLGDVILHPQFATNGIIYLSWIEGERGGLGAVVGRAKLVEEGGAARIEDISIVWRQAPKVSGRGHFGHRIAFGPDGMLYISSGERQKFDPAQDMSVNLGKVIRLKDDGSIPSDNPFHAKGGVTAQIWSLGHRNPLGLAFAPDGTLWDSEMGPAGGDELNLVKRAANYGYPKVSNGSHYDGRDIPDHSPADGFAAPKAWWNPSISPGSLMIYSGSMFPQWKGDAFIGALSGAALIRVDLNGENAAKADAWDMEMRVREVEQGPDGAIWLLEDGDNGRLLRLTAKASPADK